MQLKQLEYLVKIVECGSISQAAQNLYISQPSLTKAVSQLEKEYGIKLFVRKPRGIELTQEGEEFIYYAKGVLTAAGAMDKAFFKPEESRKSRLFVASQQLDFVYDLFLEMYQKNEHRPLHYGLREFDRGSVINSVIKGESDIGIFVHSSMDLKKFLSPFEMKRLEIHSLDKGEVFACVGPKSSLYNCETTTYEETRKQFHISLDLEEQARRVMYFKQIFVGYDSDSILSFNTVAACEQFLLKTDALLFVSKWTLNCFQNEKIHRIRVERDSSSNVYNELLWVKRANEPLSPTEQQFINKLTQRFK